MNGVVWNVHNNGPRVIIMAAIKAAALIRSNDN